MTGDDELQKTVVESCERPDGKERRRADVIAKLIGARWEVEDVLLSSGASTVLPAQERARLSLLKKVIDNMVRRMERC